MIQSNYTVIILTPSEGFMLTQAADVDIIERTVANKVYLAVNDSPDNWKEITVEEAEAIKSEQARIIEEQRLEEEAARAAEEQARQAEIESKLA